MFTNGYYNHNPSSKLPDNARHKKEKRQINYLPTFPDLEQAQQELQPLWKELGEFRYISLKTCNVHTFSFPLLYRKSLCLFLQLHLFDKANVHCITNTLLNLKQSYLKGIYFHFFCSTQYSLWSECKQIWANL